MNKDDSCLIVIDIQKKLIPFINDHVAMLSRCAWLMNLATDLAIPCILSEQYPQGLGNTVDELAQIIHQTAYEKTFFSCAKDMEFLQALHQLGRKQVVLIGIEAHVCVLQTALGLIKKGYEVFLVTDAVGSRRLIDQKYAFKRMQALGVQLVTTEMCFFEWVEKAGTAEFKQLSQRYLKSK